MRNFSINEDLVPDAPKRVLTPAASGLPWKAARRLLCISSLLALSACDLSPDLKMPEFFKPASFKEDVAVEAATVEPATDGKWKRFDETAKISEFAWWRMFNDPVLDALEEAAMKDSASLEAAINRVKRARGVADNSDAALYPTVGAGFGPVRQKPSPASIEPTLPPGTTATTKPYTLYNFNGTISYELDLFGRNRATARASHFDAEAEADNYLAARLALQADVAQTYFRVIGLRQEASILKRNLAAREEVLKLTRNQQSVGEIDALPVSAIETDVANVKADAAVVAQALAVQEHALAVLIGQPPSELKLETKDLTAPPPSVPAGIPSTLLERRPDIKRAEQQIAAANERIGVARTGYFPDISLSAMGGFTSGELSDLFEWSNRTWLIGPLAGTILTQPIFEGGKVAAAKAQSEAGFATATATYREAVLQAFREVEDQLSGLRHASDQGKAVDEALAAATRSYTIATDRYKVGYASYLDQLDAERSLLAAKRSKVRVMAERYITTVQLVRALGGSWQAPSTPEPVAAVAPVEKPADAVTAAPENSSGNWYDPIVDLVY